MRNSALPLSERQPGVNHSRWDELKQTVSQIIDLAACFDTTGVDVFFLNRAPLHGIKGSEDSDLLDSFRLAPRGTTPLTEKLKVVVEKYSQIDRNVLILIMTDGEPDGGQAPFASEVKKAIAGGKIKIQLMVCTPDDAEVAWLNQLDKRSKAFDVTDDYYTEKKEILALGHPKFTRGDWCMKAMLGPISSKFDDMDERRAKKTCWQCTVSVCCCPCKSCCSCCFTSAARATER